MGGVNLSTLFAKSTLKDYHFKNVAEVKKGLSNYFDQKIKIRIENLPTSQQNVIDKEGDLLLIKNKIKYQIIFYINLRKKTTYLYVEISTSLLIYLIKNRDYFFDALNFYKVSQLCKAPKYKIIDLCQTTCSITSLTIVAPLSDHRAQILKTKITIDNNTEIK